MLAAARALTRTLAGSLWMRLVDVGRAWASRRYATPLDAILQVEDAFCPWNAGQYRLHADGDAVT
jgi:Sterol carrier protein domain